MPNWCDNSVTISHEDPSKIEELMIYMDEEGWFEHILPVTEGNTCADVWGTKWEADSLEYDVDPDDDVLTVNFMSAWSPPIGVYQAMKEQGYYVEAYYHEPGMCFVGSWCDGQDDYHEYDHLTSKIVREFIGEELDEMYCISEMLAEYEEEELDES